MYPVRREQVFLRVGHDRKMWRYISSSVGGETLKPTVIHDAGVARCFDENVFKTKLEAKRSVSFIFPGYDRARRIDIVKAVRLRGRGITQENDESP